MILLTSLCAYVDLALLCRKDEVLLHIREHKPSFLAQPPSAEIMLAVGIIIKSAQNQEMLLATVLAVLINNPKPPVKPLNQAET